jgi:hypothetical protein
MLFKVVIKINIVEMIKKVPAKNTKLNSGMIDDVVAVTVQRPKARTNNNNNPRIWEDVALNFS